MVALFPAVAGVDEVVKFFFSFNFLLNATKNGELICLKVFKLMYTFKPP